MFRTVLLSPQKCNIFNESLIYVLIEIIMLLRMKIAAHIVITLVRL